MARTKNAKVPEVGSEAPEFNLPSAQGGSLRLGMRTATGPVIVAFFRGVWSEDDVSFFKQLSEKEDEINLAIGNVVGVGMVESDAAREFAKASGMKSYILYDYAKTATPAWGLLEKDKENGEYARPATFLIDSDSKVVEAWMDSRPNPDDLLAKVSEMTGLPKAPEEEDSEEEKPKKEKTAKKADAEGESTEGGSSEASEKPKREKPSPEEREKRRAERKAAESGEEETKAEAKSGGEAGNEAEAEGSSTEGSSTEGSSTEGSSTEGSSTEGSSTEGSSTEGSSTEGSSTEGSSTEGSSTEGAERGGSKSEDGSGEEGGESRGGEKEGKEGG